MRFLESIFLVSLLLSALALFLAPERRPFLLRYRPAIPLILAVVDVFIDHGRWQLFVAYGVAAIISLAAISGLRSTSEVAVDRPWLRRVAGLGILLVTVATAALAWLVPVFSIPNPTGKYKVGTLWLALTDSTRDETLSPDVGDKRLVVVRLWFPADSVDGIADDYMEYDVARGIAQGFGFPPFVFSHLPLVETHSYRRAVLPATPQRWPLILFSHGYAVGTESQNTVQMEELASHGFVVASIDHPYEAGAILLPSGKVLLGHPPFGVMRDSTIARRSADVVRRMGEAADTAAMKSALADMYVLSAPLDTSIVRWTDDTRFVLDRLTTMSTPHAGGDSLFSGRLLTDHVGVLGMSFGGATAASFCLVDARCEAGMNLDGLLYGEASRVALTRPFFFASSDKNEKLHRLFYERAQAPAYLLRVSGSAHMDYTDFSFVSPTLGARAGMLGGIAPTRMHALMNEIVVAYFQQTLRHGSGIDLAAFKGRFPEASLESRIGVRPPNAAVTPADSVKAAAH